MDKLETNIPELLSIQEFCRRFSISRTQTYRLIERGEIRLHKMGTASRIARSDAEAWARNLPFRQGSSA